MQPKKAAPHARRAQKHRHRRLDLSRQAQPKLTTDARIPTHANAMSYPTRRPAFIALTPAATAAAAACGVVAAGSLHAACVGGAVRWRVVPGLVLAYAYLALCRVWSAL